MDSVTAALRGLCHGPPGKTQTALRVWCPARSGTNTTLKSQHTAIPHTTQNETSSLLPSNPAAQRPRRPAGREPSPGARAPSPGARRSAEPGPKKFLPPTMWQPSRRSVWGSTSSFMSVRPAAPLMVFFMGRKALVYTSTSPKASMAWGMRWGGGGVSLRRDVCAKAWECESP